MALARSVTADSSPALNHPVARHLGRPVIFIQGVANGPRSLGPTERSGYRLVSRNFTFWDFSDRQINFFLE